MGAHSFIDRAKGRNAREAFDTLVDQAAWENGHGGYTGTIAEKSEFVMIPLNIIEAAEATAERLIREGDPRIEDKWGPAGCIHDPVNDDFVFFGWSSS